MTRAAAATGAHPTRGDDNGNQEGGPVHSDGPLVKCLIWDLDETLWQGTLLEGDDVRLRPGVRETLRELDRRGILHSVASRNDHDQALAALERLGVADYFVFPQIGWGRKPAAVRAVAEQLGFALETIAFIDDQPYELQEMGGQLPQVRCLPAEALAELTGLPMFSPETVTADAARRRERYRAGIRREQERSEFQGPDEEFLRSLDIRMTMRRADDEDLHRLSELTLRTSQMNATGVHYGHDTLSALCTEPGHEVLSVTMEDRFGSHGAIGIMLLARHERVWHLKLLATSCRVVSFGAGSVLLRWLAAQAARAGVHLIADFKRTERNRMMEVAYRFAGYGDARCDCAAGLPTADDDQIVRLHCEPVGQVPSESVRTDGVDLYDVEEPGTVNA
jgi:methoxymalonate biosynthesis protein